MINILPQRIWEQPGHMLSGCPDGLYPLLVLEAYRQTGRSVVAIFANEIELESAQALLRLRSEDANLPRNCIILPPQDCLPYDRMGSSQAVAAARVDALLQLAQKHQAGEPVLLLTTTAAIARRLPDVSSLQSACLSLQVGQNYDFDELRRYWQQLGYQHVGTVRDKGDLSIRGGIVDIFPPNYVRPVRLDFFGPVLEKLTDFDEQTQRSLDNVHEHLDLYPLNEIWLSDENVQRFCRHYQQEFGGASLQSMPYAAIKSGQHWPGREHFLPLFYERSSCLKDILPDDALWFMGTKSESDLKLIYEDAQDSFVAQCKGSFILPPEKLWLENWQNISQGLNIYQITPHVLPEKSGKITDMQGRLLSRLTKNKQIADEITMKERFAKHYEAGKAVFIACQTAGSRERMAKMLKNRDLPKSQFIEQWSTQEGNRIGLVVWPLVQSFETPDIAVYAEPDILGRSPLLKRARSAKKQADNHSIFELDAFNLGDLVVHIDHGIGRYEGLKPLAVDGKQHDFLEIHYQDNGKLYLPVENFELLTRYGGAAEGNTALDKLGGASWQGRRAKMKKRLREIAHSLVEIAARRLLRKAPAMMVDDELYEQFCTGFPYEETDDQKKSIEEVLCDIASGRPMDRLVCGDVGFGKTEVALRAAFVAAMSGKQVAVIVPTTLLARQHHAGFVKRFQNTPIKVAQLSRFVSANNASQTRRDLTTGHIDIVVGTHALLAKTIKFHDLGLLIVDEEQHFGVTHKEKLKQIRGDIHILTLTATPIPRTLQQSMTGIRDLSIIATPPIDRQAIRTFVMSFEAEAITEAIQREKQRGGQCFFVAPRITDLSFIEAFLRSALPDIRYCVAHGQMPAGQLDRLMNDFYDQKYDVLLSTTIIESGLDIPSANTMIVWRADMFGLAQLYQIRGRIGRSHVRAYAYMTYQGDKTLTKQASERLRVLESLDSLGSGFALASHDMEIRGAGNLLGDEQSGHIREVGYELYQQMLEQAVETLKAQQAGEVIKEEAAWSPKINIGANVVFPQDYVADEAVRLGLYRRLAMMQDVEQVADFCAELVDRFGPMPLAMQEVVSVIELKIRCRQLGIQRLDVAAQIMLIHFHPQHYPNLDKVFSFIQKQKKGVVSLRSDQSLAIKQSFSKDTGKNIKIITTILRHVGNLL